MSFAELFLRRPVATMLAWITIVVAGFASWLQLPIAALPKYDTPTIQVTASLLGASPETMSTSVATPLEKQFSAIPGLLATTSASIQGETKVTLEFEPTRNIDAAAGDVQAALYRATRSLPPEMLTPPSYKKINPADAAILLVGLSSPALKLTDLNAYSDNLVIPALSTIGGVAQVMVSGQKRYAVRVEVDPERLAAVDLTLPEVGAALRAANSNAPIGELEGTRQMLMLQMSGSLMRAADFARVVLATRQGQPVRLADVATVEDSIENARNTSAVNGEDSIVLYVLRQPGSNTVATVDAIRAMMPRLQAEMPASVKVQLLQDRSTSIRQAIHDVNLTLLLTVALVIMVMLLFLRRLSATVIPSITLPISLLGTFGAMAALGLSLDNISLMGLTIAVGLVVDDAIVVLENIMRHIEAGMGPFAAAVRGTREVAFTVLSISISLVAVFIPIFFMPGTIGLLFHEFAIVVTLAIAVSAAVALTLIPVLVPRLMKTGRAHREPGRIGRAFDAAFERSVAAYGRGIDWALAHRAIVLLVGAATFAVTGWLYAISPKGFFPQEDIGQVSGNVDTPQDMSYEARLAILNQLQERILEDPAVFDVASKVDHDTTAFSITLKDRSERPPMNAVLTRLRAQTNFIPGIKVLFSPVQNLRIGGRSSRSTYQYTLQSVRAGALDEWADKLMAAMDRSGVFVGLNSDSLKNGLQARLTIDREKAALLGVDMATLREALYTAYGTRQVSTIYAPEDSYQVIMEVSTANRRDETDLSKIYVRGANGALVPLGAIASIGRGKGAMAINHQGQLPAITISFDLVPGKSLSDAAAAIDAATREIAMPPSIFGAFAGAAALFQQSQSTQLWLIAIAIAVIYVILGMLYESWIHPVTILLGIPSAAVGALLALRLMGLELTFIAMIGILLLVGIVKKNAIMMIDFALEAQRESGLDPGTAIKQACLLRFRPIMMTTLCAIMGALPIALGAGAGAELRQPLGVAIVGGLVFSQLITLFITPVLFLAFDDLARRIHAQPHPQSA
jgi:hydrophobic/amphiphilic exporter-1 (mainly G- bacteria), HAE1 family